MRLWSLHPKYLDSKGIVALWREGLLAKKVLENKTRGYKHHPQLIRFKNSEHPGACINTYLHYICDEADRRGYRFDRSKLTRKSSVAPRIGVQEGQVAYEWMHLLKKVQIRSAETYSTLTTVKSPGVHPLFDLVPGGIESWEIVG